MNKRNIVKTLAIATIVAESSLAINGFSGVANKDDILQQGIRIICPKNALIGFTEISPDRFYENGKGEQKFSIPFGSPNFSGTSTLI